MKHIYCIELLFEGNHPEIQNKIENLGTDIILIPTSNFTKLHIHSEKYTEILKAVEGYTIINQRIDDNLI